MTQYTLKLSFDLRQVTQSLAYEFVLKDNSTLALEGAGPLAGTFNFQEGDEICVQVVATSAAKPGKGETGKDILEGFEVTNCTFVSIPARMTEPLSLFNEDNGCAMTGEFDSIENISTLEDEQNNILRLSRICPDLLPVVTKNGQWKISGYLSVGLTPQNGKAHSQLYFFDPEGSTGGGGFGPG